MRRTRRSTSSTPTSTNTPITWRRTPRARLKPNELMRAFVRYKHVDYYDALLFTRAYDWMKARGLTEGQSEHAALVVG